MEATLRRGFVYEGTLQQTRRRVPLSEPTPPVPIESLIFSIQNHDFVGNHPVGSRLHRVASREAQAAAAALMLLYPAIPMLFMGEEFAADTPFLFFADFGDPPLRIAVEEGRKREYPQHDWSAALSPLSEEAFEASKLPSECDADATMLAWYRDLIALRKQWQAIGLLHSGNLQAKWSDDQGVASLVYESTAHKASVLVKLHPPGATPATLSCRVHGEVILSQAADCGDASEGCWNLAGNGVLIVDGNLEVLE